MQEKNDFRSHVEFRHSADFQSWSFNLASKMPDFQFVQGHIT